MVNDLITQEQHDMLVFEYGFKKVGSRCPVCYIEHLIKKNLEDAYNGQ